VGAFVVVVVVFCVFFCVFKGGGVSIKTRGIVNTYYIIYAYVACGN
jgi:hypothetical protein